MEDLDRKRGSGYVWHYRSQEGVQNKVLLFHSRGRHGEMQEEDGQAECLVFMALLNWHI